MRGNLYRLKPISTPWRRKWQFFRIRYLPLLVFLTAAGIVSYIWRYDLNSPGLVGQVESIPAVVASPKPGFLALLSVKPFDRVCASQEVARVIIADPKIVDATLAVTKAEIEQMRIAMIPELGPQRNALDYEHLRLLILLRQTELASHRVTLQREEIEFQRIAALFKEKLVTDNEYDMKRLLLEKQRTAVNEAETMLKATRDRFTGLFGDNGQLAFPQGTNSPLLAAIEVQEKKLQLTLAELSPIVLRAPIDGTVGMIQHPAGDALTAGEAIFTISPLHAEHVVGYLYQPMGKKPVVGQVVEIRTRDYRRELYAGKVLNVGSAVEPIKNPLLHPGFTAAAGLPILVSLPPGHPLHPGELVDLTLRF